MKCIHQGRYPLSGLSRNVQKPKKVWRADRRTNKPIPNSYSPLVNSSGRGQKCGTHTYYPILVTNWQICVYKCVYTELDANILISLVGQENYLKYAIKILMCIFQLNTVEILYSTIYYSQNFIELNIDKSTQYVALWTHKRHPIPRPFGRAMECLLWVLQQKLIVL